MNVDAELLAELLLDAARNDRTVKALAELHSQNDDGRCEACIVAFDTKKQLLLHEPWPCRTMKLILGDK